MRLTADGSWQRGNLSYAILTWTISSSMSMQKIGTTLGLWDTVTVPPSKVSGPTSFTRGHARTSNLPPIKSTTWKVMSASTFSEGQPWAVIRKSTKTAETEGKSTCPGTGL